MRPFLAVFLIWNETEVFWGHGVMLIQENDFFCSVVIPTIGRSTLDRAVRSVLSQDFRKESFEVIVVNDSGTPLPGVDWCENPQVRVISTNRRERSVARNTGAAVALGSYLCFLDDDDWLLPNALGEYWRLSRENPEAVWLQGGIRVVDEEGNWIAETSSEVCGNCLGQIVGGAWLPIQAACIRADAFFQAGCYDSAICGTEDQDLCRRVAVRGNVASSRAVLACLSRGRGWSTSTNYRRAGEDTRISRDYAVSQPGNFRRMLTSTNSSYWRGRLLHVYVSLALWNLRNGRFWTALSRVLGGIGVAIFSARYLAVPGFWRGARDEHVPDSLHFILQSGD